MNKQRKTANFGLNLAFTIRSLNKQAMNPNVSMFILGN